MFFIATVTIVPQPVYRYMGLGHKSNWICYRKGILDKLKKAQLGNRGGTSTMSYGPLCCLKYLDAQVVYLLSTTGTSFNVKTG